MNKASGWLVIGLLASAVALAAPDPDRVALEAAMHRWTTAVNAQDVRVLSATMTDDVELFDSTTTVKGRDAAIRALREVVSRGRLAATTLEIKTADDLAWRVVALAQTQKEGVVHARGHALEIWQRVKGEWRLHRQMATGVLNPAVSVSKPLLDDPVLDQPIN